jgi:hypothetical protein
MPALLSKERPGGLVEKTENDRIRSPKSESRPAYPPQGTRHSTANDAMVTGGRCLLRWRYSRASESGAAPLLLHLMDKSRRVF